MVGSQPAAVIAFDEIGLTGRRGGGVRVWTAVVEESDGSRWADFEVGDRSGKAFLRLYERLPEAELYRTDAYRVYGRQPADRHEVGKGGAVNWN